MSNPNEKIDIPPEFICPISLEIMKIPMIFPDGQTYEKDSIKKALSINPHSPLTKISMKFEEGKINYALKNLIETFLKQNPQINPNEKIEVEREKIQNIPKKEKIEFSEISANYILDPKNEKSSYINIKLKPKNPNKRNPLLLIAMLDISSSMNEDACKDVKEMEDLSFSRLQLVLHSINTIISSLENDDLLCLITFNNRGEIILDPINMDEDGKKTSFKTIKKIFPKGATNIWDALRIGINVAKKYSETNYNTNLLLFTDGEPNINPPMGIVPSLKEYLSDINVKFTISTFAFGYNVDSKLMEEIANYGNGIYGYCPDCTMVGTIFINFMSNILTSISPIVEIDVSNNSLNNKIVIGGLYEDVYRNCLIKVNSDDIKNTKINVLIKNSNQEFNVNIGNEIINENEKKEFLNQYYRFKLIDLIQRNLNIKDKSIAEKEINELYNEIKNIKDKSEFLNNLLIDLIDDNPNHGQVLKAFDNKYYEKWGKDYLPSFLRFHIVEQCGNFKDQSLQLYGGEKFNEYRKKCNKIFLELQPPERIENNYEHHHHHYNNNYNYNYSMDRFMNYDGGCFNGNGNVKLINNKIKKVKDIVKGDILFNGSIVECVIITKVKKKQFAVEINNVLLTPYHPIFYNGNWVFPINVKEPEEYYIDYWYNLILRNGYSVNINNIDAITLGHNQNYGILKHPYFGTEKVIQDLKSYMGFDNGLVFINEMPKVIRDENGFISSYY